MDERQGLLRRVVFQLQRICWTCGKMITTLPQHQCLKSPLTQVMENPTPVSKTNKQTKKHLCLRKGRLPVYMRFKNGNTSPDKETLSCKLQGRSWSHTMKMEMRVQLHKRNKSTKGFGRNELLAFLRSLTHLQATMPQALKIRWRLSFPPEYKHIPLEYRLILYADHKRYSTSKDKARCKQMIRISKRYYLKQWCKCTE